MKTDKIEKQKAYNAMSIIDFGMIIFYAATMVAFALVGSVAGCATRDGEVNMFTYLAYISLILSLISGPFLIIGFIKLNTSKKNLE